MSRLRHSPGARRSARKRGGGGPRPTPPATPSLGLDQDDRGQPRVALNLILGRQPEPGEGPLAGLVEGGLLGLTARIEAADTAVPRWRFALMLGDTTSASAESLLPRAALSAMLDQGAARAVMDRLSGLEGPPLRLVAQPVGGPPAGQPGMLTLEIRLDRLHAALADPGLSVLDASALETGFLHALAAGDLAATPRHDPATLARDRAVNLPRRLPMLLHPAPQGHVLRPPPAWMTRLTLPVGLTRVDPSPAPPPRPLVADLGELLAAAVADSAGADRILRFPFRRATASLRRCRLCSAGARRGPPAPSAGGRRWCWPGSWR